MRNVYDVQITGKHNAESFPPTWSAENTPENKILNSDRTNQNESFYRIKFRKKAVNSRLKAFETF